MYKRNTCLKMRVWLLLFIPLCYFYVVPPSMLLASGIEIIDAEFLKKQLSDSDGKVMIIDFWATWCSPCQKQVAVLSRLHEQYESIGLTIIGVSLDKDMKKVKNFMGKQEIKYPVYLGNHDMLFDYDIRALPTTFIYNKDRDLVEKHVGFMRESELKQITENILEINNG